MSELAAATSPEARRAAVLLVPVGALEQHGPHLPLDTDTVIARAVGQAVAERLADHTVQAWLTPAIAFGSSGEHQSFAGTLSIGREALVHQVLELVRSASTWTHRVVLLNGHGGNAPALTDAVTQLRHEKHDVTWLPCLVEAEDLHAGRTETSLLLHLRPSSVHLELAEAGNCGTLADLLPAMRSGGVAAVSPNGVLGDPAGANAAEGAAHLAAMGDALALRVLARPGIAVG